MARPKGTIQKRDESKYWLPEGVKLIDDLGNPNYRKETILLFEDSKYGQFKSYFKALQDANASTHPSAVKERRENTNLERHGHINAGATKQSRDKARNTMLTKYGVENALENPELLKKAQATLMKNYGVTSPSKSPEIQEKWRQNFKKNYGVDNPAKVKEFQDKMKTTSIERYGYDNPSKAPEIRERILEALSEIETTGSSKGELKVKEFVESLGLQTKKSYIGGANPKQLDIFIPDLNIAIEYNGCYYHSEHFPNVTPKMHLEKTLACENKGIRLIQIFDNEWENKPRQLKSFLRSALGKNSIFIAARECTFKAVSKENAKIFLEEYHILGSTNIQYAYGLYHKDELISLATLSLHHRNNKELILNRYVVKEDVTVQGGLSKLCKNIADIHIKFSTWIDRRFSNGTNWVNSGWKIVGTLKPDYFYFDKKHSKKVNKQSRKKALVNTPNEMTEHQHALSDELYRVYDCGKIKLTWGD